MSLNGLLHELVSRIAHPSEAARDALHAQVDDTVPPEAPAAPATGKGASA